MSRKYKFRDQNKLYFVSFAVVYWIDVFIRNEYKEIILRSIQFCQKEKGLEIYAWCIMTSHIHLIIGTHGNRMQDILRDLKTYTSNNLRKCIQENRIESRKEWILRLMKCAGNSRSNNNQFQFWQQHNKPVELVSNYMMDQKLNYIHSNPVRAGFVESPEYYLYSSAKDYYGGRGLLDIMFIE